MSVALGVAKVYAGSRGKLPLLTILAIIKRLPSHTQKYDASSIIALNLKI
jgi:hypothetical protein